MQHFSESKDLFGNCEAAAGGIYRGVSVFASHSQQQERRNWL
jgi:hypothetical protein